MIYYLEDSDENYNYIIERYNEYDIRDFGDYIAVDTEKKTFRLIFHDELLELYDQSIYLFNMITIEEFIYMNRENIINDLLK